MSPDDVSTPQATTPVSASSGSEGYGARSGHKRFGAVHNGVVTSVARDHSAAFAMHADRNVARECDPMHGAALIAEVGDGVMLGRAVVPHRDVAEFPVPSNCVLQPCDPILEDPEQCLRLGAVDPENRLDEVAEQQRPLAGLRMNPHHRVMSLVMGGLKLGCVLQYRFSVSFQRR